MFLCIPMQYTSKGYTQFAAYVYCHTGLGKCVILCIPMQHISSVCTPVCRVCFLSWSLQKVCVPLKYPYAAYLIRMHNICRVCLSVFYTRKCVFVSLCRTPPRDTHNLQNIYLYYRPYKVCSFVSLCNIDHKENELSAESLAFGATLNFLLKVFECLCIRQILSRSFCF